MLVFIDGAEGTTGLQIEERLSEIPCVELLKPESGLRKDIGAREEYINRADVVFLCLPDAAARESAALVRRAGVVLIDASTAHRTAKGWAYGFPELSPKHYKAVETSDRIAVPGCHASGFCAVVYPLVAAGIIKHDETLFCNSLTGYSGGGKRMIDEYEGGAVKTAARGYSLGIPHKHLPEMQYVCGLEKTPVFQPVIVNARQGMVVSVPLLHGAEIAWETLRSHYSGADTISVMPLNCCSALDLEGVNGTDCMEIYVFGDNRQAIISARLDNLGKGASGAALQCMKIRMGMK